MLKKLIIAATLLTVIVIAIPSCQHAAWVMPVSERTGDPNICFERDILPIFQSNCSRGGCHDAGSRKGGYVLDNYANVMKKGIVPGNPAASVIWQSVSMNVFGVDPMPRDAPGLTEDELYLVRQWIATGAIDSGGCSTSNCDTNNFTYSTAIAPMIQTHCIGCHASSSASGSLADYASVKNAAVNGRLIGDIQHLAGYNAMPQSGAMLEDCQITQVLKWVAAGAPNN